MNPEVLSKDKEQLAADYSGMLGQLFPEEKEKMRERLLSQNPVPLPASASQQLNSSLSSSEDEEEKQQAESLQIQIEEDEQATAKQVSQYGYLLPMWSILLEKVSISSALSILIFDVIPFIDQDITLLSYFFRITEPHLKDLSEDDVIFAFDSLIAGVEDEQKELWVEMCLEVLGLIKTKTDHVFSELVELVLSTETSPLVRSLIAQYLLAHYQDFIDRSLTAVFLHEQLLQLSERC